MPALTGLPGALLLASDSFSRPNEGSGNQTLTLKLDAGSLAVQQQQPTPFRIAPRALDRFRKGLCCRLGSIGICLRARHCDIAHPRLPSFGDTSELEPRVGVAVRGWALLKSAYLPVSVYLVTERSWHSVQCCFIGKVNILLSSPVQT